MLVLLGTCTLCGALLHLAVLVRYAPTPSGMAPASPGAGPRRPIRAPARVLSDPVAQAIGVDAAPHVAVLTAPDADAERGPSGTPASTILGQSPRELLRSRLARLRPAWRARARFSAAASEHDIRASQLSPSVAALFDSMELEPVLDARGMLLGLSIASLAPDSPMRGAGFQPADRITHIAGQRLRDPAALPPLLLRLGSRIDFCAERAGEAICNEIILD